MRKAKKAILIPVIIIMSALALSLSVSANMAAPRISDVGSSITFEKNETISVLSEVLDITVHGAQADIVATYKMKNTIGDSVSTQSMFLSPNIKSSGVRVTAGAQEVRFTSESYSLYYELEIETNDWKYAVLTNEDNAGSDDEQTVDTITFELNFAPYEELDVVVSYTYSLGGYPEYDTNAKRGEIFYYLAPAAMWNGFQNLTVNLYLDRDMPVITQSSLEFEKTGTRTYQYVSTELPDENLEITIDENWLQNIFSTFRSPYTLMAIIMWLPLILIVLVPATVIIIVLYRRKKKKAGVKDTK